MILEEAAIRAFEAKSRQRNADISVGASDLNLNLLNAEARGLFGPEYEDFDVGQYVGLENIRLRWVSEDWFEFIPRSSDPFTFVRANGERITPRRMFTDGGSIPRPFRLADSLSPWGYAPAYLIHDWEFDLHHCERTEKHFEEVRDTMMEAIRTLMELAIVEKAPVTFRLVYAGINSRVAREVWDRHTDDCPLPPDRGEP